MRLRREFLGVVLLLALALAAPQVAGQNETTPMPAQAVQNKTTTPMPANSTGGNSTVTPEDTTTMPLPGGPTTDETTTTTTPPPVVTTPSNATNPSNLTTAPSGLGGNVTSSHRTTSFTGLSNSTLHVLTLTGGGSTLTIPPGAFSGTASVNITMSLSPVNYSISRLPAGAQAAGEGLTLDLGGGVPVVPLSVSVLAQLTASQAAMLRPNPPPLNTSTPNETNTNASTGNVTPVNSSNTEDGNDWNVTSVNSSNTENGNDGNNGTMNNGTDVTGGARRLLAENGTSSSNVTNGNSTQNGTANVSNPAVVVYYEVKLHWLDKLNGVWKPICNTTLNSTSMHVSGSLDPKMVLSDAGFDPGGFCHPNVERCGGGGLIVPLLVKEDVCAPTTTTPTPSRCLIFHTVEHRDVDGKITVVEECLLTEEEAEEVFKAIEELLEELDEFLHSPMGVGLIAAFVFAGCCPCMCVCLVCGYYARRRKQGLGGGGSREEGGEGGGAVEADALVPAAVVVEEGVEGEGGAKEETGVGVDASVVEVDVDGEEGGGLGKEKEAVVGEMGGGKRRCQLCRN